ncbi:MAG TPA: thioredoxin family protein [bacterium]|nr:thioredoxin family protein [bacterium]
MAKLKTVKGVKEHKVVDEKTWLAARKALLVEEKKFTKLRDQLNEQRRALPWVKVDKKYIFDASKGTQTLADLFNGKSQLIVWHFMFGPDWKEGCGHCSFWADSFNGNIVHMAARDTTLIAVSRAPLKKIEPFKKRMGWGFNWVSSFNTDFNYDYQASFSPEDFRKGRAMYNFRMIDPFSDELHGVSCFYKDSKGDVYHTYSTYSRGVDMLNNAYMYLDLTAKGRDEDWSRDFASDWVRHHDKYRGL